MPVEITEVNYKNYGKCICLTTDKIKLMATLEVGPRIIYFSMPDRENVLFEDVDRNFEMNVEGYGTWYGYGGHRVWLAPEVLPETYFPDNTSVSYSFENNKLVMTQEVTDFGKQYSIECMINDDGSVDVYNIIKNCSDKPQYFAPWSVTGLAPGGTEFITLETKDTGFLPNRTIALWPYSDIKDSRFTMTNSAVELRQDPEIKQAFKAGFNVTNGEIEYRIGNQIFINSFDPYNEEFNYPDFSCNFETYTNNLFLECELLGDLRYYQPGEKAIIHEKWQIKGMEG